MNEHQRKTCQFAGIAEKVLESWDNYENEMVVDVNPSMLDDVEETVSYLFKKIIMYDLMKNFRNKP